MRNQTINGLELIDIFEEFAPKSLALEGDKIGLQIGSLKKPVKKVMIALDVLDVVVDEAIAEGVDLIISHHPPIFRPLKHVTTDEPSGRIVEKCIKNDIAVYAAHTNLDIADGGVNDLMVEALGLTDVEVLVPTIEDKLKKLIVFVPTEHADGLRNALGNVGAGYIGNYSHCTFNSSGVGTFLPLEGTNPFIGTKGDLAKVEEIKLETIFPSSIKEQVIRTLLENHPYEEPAYDIYPLDNNGRMKGLGRLGLLEKELTLKDFAEHVKKAFDIKGLRVVGKLDSKVKRVALLGGDGNKYMMDAKQKNADVYITGDMYYHVAHDAMMIGLNIIDPGHNVEKVMKKGVQTFLQKKLSNQGFDTEIIISKINTDPFTFL